MELLSLFLLLLLPTLPLPLLLLQLLLLQQQQLFFIGCLFRLLFFVFISVSNTGRSALHACRIIRAQSIDVQVFLRRGLQVIKTNTYANKVCDVNKPSMADQ